MNVVDYLQERETSVAAVLIDDSTGHELGRLMQGGSINVGSDSSANVQIVGDGVAPIHCQFVSGKESIWIRDCHGTGGTSVNGEMISESAVELDSKVQLGSVVFRLESVRPESFAPKTELAPQPQVASGSNRQTVSNVEIELQTAHSEIQILRERLAASTPIVSTIESDPFQDEMIELLRSEVIELQRALSDQSEAQMSPVMTSDLLSENASVEVTPVDGETEKLVTRLEQLLEELEQRDEQVALLHTLLEAAEEANRAEQDEREQLIAWVPDIERRLSERELEWQAEREQLQADNQRITEERDQVEALKLVDSSDTRTEALQRMASEARAECEGLRNQMRTATSVNAKLQRELEQVQDSVSKEEVVRVAMERAELARMRHDLESRMQELAEQSERPAAGLAIDHNLRVLREHLKEIQEQEKTERAIEREERTLGSRIAGLWKRIDGR